LRRLWDEGEAATVVDAVAMGPQTYMWNEGEIFVKADTVTSKMVVSDCRAMGVPIAANGKVVVASWEETARNMEVMFGGG
jgi:hypothetical protein